MKTKLRVLIIETFTILTVNYREWISGDPSQLTGDWRADDVMPTSDRSCAPSNGAALISSRPKSCRGIGQH